MSSLDFDEQRAFARVSTKLDVVVSKCCTFPAIDVPCRMVDLSFGGAKLLTSEVVGEPGDTVEILLRSDAAHSMLLKGEILQSIEQHGQRTIRIRFKGLPVTDQVKLDHALYRFSHNSLEFFGGVPLSPFRRWPQAESQD